MKGYIKDCSINRRNLESNVFDLEFSIVFTSYRKKNRSEQLKKLYGKVAKSLSNEFDIIIKNSED